MAKEIEISNRDRVHKGNTLVEAKIKLPLIEQRILAIAISKINPTRNSLENPYRFTVKSYCELVGVKERGMFEAIDKAIQSLTSRGLEKYDPDTRQMTYYNWLDKAVVHDNGKIDIYFHKDLENDLLAKKKYSEYLLKHVLEFKSKYAIRFYELLESWAYKGTKEINIDVLREMVGLEEADYPRYSDFKKRVLTKSILEINTETDLHVEVNEFRKNKKVNILEFVITKAPPRLSKVREKVRSEKVNEAKPVENWLIPSKEDKLAEELGDIGIPLKAALRLIEEEGLDKVKKGLSVAILERETGKIREGTNFTGVVVNKIRDPDPVTVGSQSTSDSDLKSRRTKLMSWFESKGAKYDPYRYEGTWTGITVFGKTVNFMDYKFKETIENLLG